MHDYEDDVRRCQLLTLAVTPYRGRHGRLDTDHFTGPHFTEAELDAVAPLDRFYTATDEPCAEARAAIQRRIDAARRLKYGS